MGRPGKYRGQFHDDISIRGAQPNFPPLMPVLGHHTSPELRDAMRRAIALLCNRLHVVTNDMIETSIMSVPHTTLNADHPPSRLESQLRCIWCFTTLTISTDRCAC